MNEEHGGCCPPTLTCPECGRILPQISAVGYDLEALYEDCPCGFDPNPQKTAEDARRADPNWGVGCTLDFLGFPAPWPEIRDLVRTIHESNGVDVVIRVQMRVSHEEYDPKSDFIFECPEKR